MCDHVEAAFRRVVLSAAAMFPEIKVRHLSVYPSRV